MEKDEVGELKNKIAEIIINCNLIEKKMKQIISSYIASSRHLFIEEILLNNKIINLGSKLGIIEYILKTEGFDTSFTSSIRVLLAKRNIVAHSDTVLEKLRITDVEIFEDPDSPDGFFYHPIYEYNDPPVSATINQGVLKYENIEKIYSDFNKHHELAMKGLKQMHYDVIKLKAN
ncbi:MAG: hypothetical protein ABJ387_13995 [Balneola sp.]